MGNTMIVKMQWQVIYGGGLSCKYFPDVKSAKDFARDYNGSQIVENSGMYKFVRYIVKNDKVVRL